MKSTVAELLVRIEAKCEELRTTRAELRGLRAEMKICRKEENAAKKTAETAKLTCNFSGPWLEALASGVTAKRVVALQNIDADLKTLSVLIGVSAARARQIRAMALADMRHPDRHALARKLGLAERLGLSKTDN